MDKRESLWDLYLRKGMSRRSFLKACVALTTLMGLTTDQVSKVVEAAETKPLPVVISIWSTTTCFLLPAESPLSVIWMRSSRSTRGSTSWQWRALPALRTMAFIACPAGILSLIS